MAAAKVVGMTPLDLEIEGLSRWLDQLEVMRDGVALALHQRQEIRQLQRWPVSVTGEVTPKPRPRTVPSRQPVRRRHPITPGAVSWWASASAQGFTALVQRDHLARMAATREASMVRGDICDQ